MNTFEGIEITLRLGDLRKECSFTFIKFDSEEFFDFVRGSCKEFITDTKLDDRFTLSPS